MIYPSSLCTEGKDRNIKLSLYAALLLLSLSVICQAKPSVRRFIVEVGQNSDFSSQCFSIKNDRLTLSDNLSDIAETNCHEEPNSSPYVKRHKLDSYELKTPLIESISCQWLYATNLLVAYELILNNKAPPINLNPYLWLPLEAVITIGWLLKNYWKLDSPLYNPIEQQEASQSLPFAITAMMPGSEHTSQQGQPSESSGQLNPQATTKITGYFSSLLYSDSDSADGNGGPQQHSHTLCLNCYVYPCHGLCQFKKSSCSYNSGTPDCEENSAGYAEATPGQSSYSPLANRHYHNYNSLDGVALDGVASDGVASDGVAFDSMVTGAADATSPAQQATCNVIVFGEDGLLRQCGKVYKNKKILLSHKSGYHTGQKACDAIVTGEDNEPRLCGASYQNAKTLWYHKSVAHSGQQTCVLSMIGENGQQRPCGKICESIRSLTVHKSRYHTGQKTCCVNVICEDGQQRPCGKVCINTAALMHHKSKEHCRQQTCSVAVIGDDGQLQPCGRVCKSGRSLSSHKSNVHSGEKNCDMIVVAENGQKRACGKVCKNAQALSEHKSSNHSERKTCDVTVAGEDGQQWACEKVCNSAKALREHKRIFHTGRQTCDIPVVGKDGQSRPCGKVYNNARAIMDHRRRVHTEKKSCDSTVVAEDGQLRQCGKVCKNAHALSQHKRRHRKRKPLNVGQEDDLSPLTDTHRHEEIKTHLFF
ncbi:hypothetical protein [Endozoicomonas sp. 8E]|uniref:hypothetical protein n=1 Tax=Endozoicomonas sp. 8E TaxID=3035692 RepID=UPI002938DA5F|nr:hypothetical protein [Endozoicomonas sp. 8E]WOG26931.1 hypothetical protein P6910_20635 [Endozoicomonas sp. 8E]